MPATELTNMVMIQDIATGKVIVQNRVKSWKGISFPGGHVNDGESFSESAIREIKEETGLTVSNLTPCGIVHWCHKLTNDRYIELFYKTSEFSGTLIDETDEGKVFWASFDEITTMPLSPNFAQYLKVFQSETFIEAFGLYDDIGFEILNFIT